MVQIVQDVVTWLKQWFYDEDEIDTKIGGLQSQINNKAETSTVTSLTTTVNGKADKTGGVAQVTDANANNYTNIGVIPANSSQQSINSAINNAIGNLKSIKAIEVVSTLPTASADTMGKLYIISEDSKINVYYTEQNGTSYAWHKMDADILDELSIDWYDIDNKPTTFTPSTHKHGNISNNGAISASSTGNPNKIIGTDSYNTLWSFSQIGTNQSVESNALSNIGTNANASQSTINTAINTKIGSKQDKGDCVTSIELVPKSQDATGAIKLYYGDEPTNNS